MDFINEFGISSTTSSNQGGFATALGTEDEGTGEEFENFIRLLTTQVQNQDPLSPLDSTQFVEQLATFSTLEQQVRSNSSLETIATTIGDLHSLIASDWIGRSVTVEASTVPFNGQPIEFSFDAPTSVDRAELTIRDMDNNVLYSQSLDKDQELHSWAGQSIDGSTVAPGTLLQISIDLFDDGQFAGSAAPRILTTVTDVASENGQLRLGTEMQMSTDISSIRLMNDS